MKDIYEIIKMAKERPQMYTGDKTLKSMFYFLEGANCALNFNGSNPSPDFTKFHTWVRERLHLSSIGHHYYHTLIEYCNHNEELALVTFYELIEEYKTDKYPILS